MRQLFTTFLVLIAIQSFIISGNCQVVALKSGAAGNPTAIIGAMETELQLLKSQLADSKEVVIEGIRFFSGRLNNCNVVITRSGVGKVNAAIITTLLLEHFKPAQVLFSGIAGGLKPGLVPGDVVIANQIAYHDYGRKLPDSFETWATRNAIDFSSNPTYFKCDSALLVLAKTAVAKASLQAIDEHIPRASFGTIITGDIFLSDETTGNQLRNRTGADAVEMEGAAVAQVCYQRKTPFLIIRSLSDNANHSAALDFTKYGKIAAENSAEIILQLLALIL
ncbi:MAG: 5'-methylthioadenosine/adenosylhomocysteine nucleosidase [Bacteroidota bacterium]